MMFFGLILPSCLIPKFITGSLKLAASTIPMEEFPIIALQFLNKFEYNNFDENFTNLNFLFVAQIFLNLLMIIW